MPIAYTQSTVCYRADGRVADIEYHSGNEAFASLVGKMSCRALP